MLWKRRRVPRLLRDRIPCDLEDFVGRHFPSGPRRDAARRLWRFIEGFSINLSGLHPDDDLAALLGAAHLDRLDALELLAALRGKLFVEQLGHDVRVPTFRECVDAICASPSRHPQRDEAPVESPVHTVVRRRKPTPSLSSRPRDPRRVKGK
jgi:hypothetical protein